MKAFTFSQLAIIIFVLIGLITVIVIAVMVINDYNMDSGTLIDGLTGQTQSSADMIKSCTSIGGECIFGGCGSKIDMGSEYCENEGETCCVWKHLLSPNSHYSYLQW